MLRLKLSGRWLALAAVSAVLSHTTLAQTPSTGAPLDVTVKGRKVEKVAVQSRTSSSFFMRATDAAGKDVQGLTVKDLAVKQGGDNLRVTRVTPLRGTDFVAKQVVLVVDNSTSMMTSADILLQSLQAFLDTLGAGAEVATVMFEEDSEWMKLHPVTYEGKDMNLDVLDFTTDHERIMDHARLWFKSHMTNRTYLRDASLYGMSMLDDVPAYMQKSLVIMSDGDDVGSQFSLDQVLDRYVADVKVYMIDFDPGDAEIETLKKIREKTDGNWYLAKEPKDLLTVFSSISRDLGTVYLVEYKGKQSVESHLLNAVFFDENSSTLRPAYRTYPDHKSSLDFDETGFTNAMDTYHNVLNIVGARMHMYPKATLTLTGCNADFGEEKGNKALSQKRAEAVKTYLTTVWRVDPARITIEARDLPAKPSAGGIAAGREENRRVEIASSNPGVLKPVLTNRAIGEVNDQGVVAEVYSLQLFDFNSAAVGPENKAMLAQVAASYKEVAGGKVKAVGFTDNIGDAAYNTKLATDRAKNVHDILAGSGVPKESMSYAGLGPDDPQFKNDTPEGRFFNRTVRVILTYPKM